MDAKYTASMEARREFNRQMNSVEKNSLTDRQEARAEWLDALKNSPEIIAERVGWLIDGNYGWGSYEVTRETIHNTRANRTAFLGITIAALEWQCPSAFARVAWNQIDKQQQAKITALLQAEIDRELEREAAED